MCVDRGGVEGVLSGCVERGRWLIEEGVDRGCCGGLVGRGCVESVC